MSVVARRDARLVVEAGAGGPWGTISFYAPLRNLSRPTHRPRPGDELLVCACMVEPLGSAPGTPWEGP